MTLAHAIGKTVPQFKLLTSRWLSFVRIPITTQGRMDFTKPCPFLATIIATPPYSTECPVSLVNTRKRSSQLSLPVHLGIPTSAPFTYCSTGRAEEMTKIERSRYHCGDASVLRDDNPLAGQVFFEVRQFVVAPREIRSILHKSQEQDVIDCVGCG